MAAATASAVDGKPVSVVQLYGEQQSSCGYCKPNDTPTSRSYGMLCSKMLVEDYERLMLVGWRRSGTYFYKPTMHTTCCPQYPIRLEVDRFAASKSQKLVMRRVQRFLETGDIRMNSEPKSKVVDAGNGHELDSSRSPDSGDSVAAASEVSSPAAVSSLSNPKLLTIDTVKPEFTEERFQLYKKYQHLVHNDVLEDLSPEGFTRFLVTSPLQTRPSSKKSDAGEARLGTFHQLYRLDGQLIAVGVIDLLPTGLSSVYVFYDPDCRDLVLGKYTAMKEIEYCKQHGFKYYYMGFYIHSCVKMRYKGEYKPSELLCPTTLQWYPLADVIPLLDRFKFSPLEPTLANERTQLEVTLAVGNGRSSDTRSGDANSVIANASAVDGIPAAAPTAADLSRYAPRFAGLSVGSDPTARARLMIAMNLFPLDIGDGSLASFNMLNEKGKKIVEPFLSEWINHCGPSNAKHFIVKLC
jgi:arginine-tRNA-protein transferase